MKRNDYIYTFKLLNIDKEVYFFGSCSISSEHDITSGYILNQIIGHAIADANAQGYNNVHEKDILFKVLSLVNTTNKKNINGVPEKLSAPLLTIDSESSLVLLIGYILLTTSLSITLILNYFSK